MVSEVWDGYQKDIYPWRLAIAEAKLRRGEDSILRIATDVGYESDAAISRAFKREFGLLTAAWRRQLAHTP